MGGEREIIRERERVCVRERERERGRETLRAEGVRKNCDFERKKRAKEKTILFYPHLDLLFFISTLFWCLLREK